MFIDLRDKMISVLTRIRDRGYGPEDAINHIVQSLGSRYSDVSKVNVLTSKLIADVIHSAYQDATTPLEIAEILRILGYASRDVVGGIHEQFPQLTPEDVGRLVLHERVYPSSSRASFIAAMTYGGFSNEESEQAAKILYS
ncbi:hypothetical protein Dpoa2040_003654 [Dickeya sp. CFBP 2040]|uniref:Uncharacterized protein n=1 Tax=Dickeya poaceiphila TaxID=568768 RepID=A0A5B8IHW7_9GAMM|nr:MULTISPECIES: hypothetical protein [Dickeya]NKI76311.1 hypothetical protein [Dickeya sp. CFBP 2040]QDX31250.1 hypothetical protein Dpoa569_0003242 [Dickeya poaceiphila]